MNDLMIEGSHSTPSVNANWQQGVVYIEGDSYPENSYELYTDLVAWVSHFLKTSSQPLTLELRLLYLNTSSIKVMMDIFDEMEAFYQEGRQVAVNWYFDKDNERVAELAEEFKEDCHFAFEIIGQ